MSRDARFQLRNELWIAQDIKIIVVDITQATRDDFLYTTTFIGRCQT
jgi:hypothetical protein